MNLGFLYTRSELTPWKENVNVETLDHLLNHTPAHFKAKIIHFEGFTFEMLEELKKYDIIFNLCYGYDTADQVKVAEWLEDNRIFHTASGMESMTIAQDKGLLPFLCGQIDIPTPDVLYTCESLLDDTLYISKPRKGSCHRNICIQTGQWMKQNLTPEANDLIIQPYITGREFSVAVIPSENGSTYLSLPPVEIIPVENNVIFVAGSSFGKTYRELSPDLDHHSKGKLMNYALQMHQKIGLRSMSRTDFRMSDDGTIYVLDVNAMPNLDPEKSLMPAVCEHHGVSSENLISRIIMNALFFANFIDMDALTPIIAMKRSDNGFQNYVPEPVLLQPVHLNHQGLVI